MLPAAAAEAAAPKGAVHPDPVVAHVRNPRTGEVAVYVGEKEVVVRDKDLAARIGRIAKTAR